MCGMTTFFQLLPPSWLTLATSLLEPPLEYRSCWNPPTRLAGFAGFTAICGSTSVPRKTVPLWAAPLQPAANGLGPDTEITADGAAVAKPARPIRLVRLIATVRACLWERRIGFLPYADKGVSICRATRSGVNNVAIVKALVAFV